MCVILEVSTFSTCISDTSNLAVIALLPLRTAAKLKLSLSTYVIAFCCISAACVLLKISFGFLAYNTSVRGRWKLIIRSACEVAISAT